MRRTFRYNATTGKMDEVWNNSDRLEGKVHIHANFEPFKSPIDGTIISDRGGLRRHMQKHDVVNPLDYKEHFQKKAKERELRAQGIHPEQRAERIRTVSDSYERVRNQRIAEGIWGRRR